ncbi:MAG: hypothetical protein LPJ99_09755 [Cyclobacteriaceae bacterium]|nr:hypothetical protein [Cyclobacteriaceae bacterium]
MIRIMTLISLSTQGIAQIKADPELPKREMEFVEKWKSESLLEHFYISVSKKDAVLIFQNVDETQTRKLIESLPYFPFMEKIEYHALNRQF